MTTPNPHPHRRRRGDRGATEAAELAIGLLVLAATAIGGVTTASWFERAAAARAAADEAARAVVVADTWSQGAADAQAVVDDIATNYGIAGGLSLQLEGELARGATVTAHVTVDMPAPAIPLVGTVATSARTISHTETVDIYRSLPE